jgi:hypothetical protein
MHGLKEEYIHVVVMRAFILLLGASYLCLEKDCAQMG